jgi:hypothetical protein
MNVKISNEMVALVRRSLEGANKDTLVPIMDMAGHFARVSHDAKNEDGFDHLCEVDVDGQIVQVYLKR